MFEPPLRGPHVDTYDRRRDHLLAIAARVFADRGFHRTSMRDLSRETGMSLAGMYYYVKGKEDLLFQIQKACVERVGAGAAAAVAARARPEERLLAFVRHHVLFFAEHKAEMKVLSHEAGSLSGEMLETVRGLERGYADLCLGLLAEIEAARAPGTAAADRAVAAYALFGMMNWIHTWYDPAGRLSPDDLAATLGRLFLHGFSGAAPAG